MKKILTCKSFMLIVLSMVSIGRRRLALSQVGVAQKETRVKAAKLSPVSQVLDFAQKSDRYSEW